MLKRMLVAAVFMGLAAAPLGASAGQDIDGSILLPNPVAVALGYGLTEAGSACDPDGLTQGVDGFWVELDGETTATLTLTANAATADLSLWYYDATCTYMSGIDANGVGGGEAGAVPGTAAYVIVDMFVGAAAGFNLLLQ